MKRSGILFTVFSAMIMLNACDESPSEDQKEPGYSFLVGTYTDTEDQGIEYLSFEPEAAVISSKVLAEGIDNPSFVITNKARTLVFAVEETSGDNGGKVLSFGFDRDNQKLELISEAVSFGDHPCYLSLDPSERFLIVGNYSGGNFSAYEIKDGELIHVQTIQHEGGSIVQSRQDKAHVHSAVFHPNGKQLLIGDLGTDKIHLYDFNPDFAVPFAHASPAYFEVDPGSGPRHIAIHPDGNQLYLVHELTAELGVYSYDQGKISRQKILPLTAEDFMGNVGAAEVRVSPDGKFVYASNRGDANEISVFEIGKDGEVLFVQRISSGGIMPRNFALTPDGEFLLAANQASNDIIVFERNKRTGKLTPTSIKGTVHKPVYLFSLD